MKKAKNIIAEIWTQEMINKFGEMAVENVDTEREKEVIRLQLKGGNCPKCNSPYRYKKVGGWGYYLPACECQAKFDRERKKEARIQEGLRVASVPKIYLGASFDKWVTLEELEGARKEILEHLTTGGMREKGLMLRGDNGTGKTWAGVCVLRCAVANRKTILFVKMHELVRKLIEDGKSQLYERINSVNILMLDDFGKLSIASEWTKTAVFGIIDNRITECRQMIITANETIEELVGKFGKSIMSRLVGSLKWVDFSGPDRRLGG